MVTINGTNNSYLDEIIGFSIIIIIFIFLGPLLARSFQPWVVAVAIVIGMVLGGILSALAATYLKLEIFEEEFDDTVESIDLSNRSIRTIDLNVLPDLKKLKELNLEDNLIEQLDFAPFKKHPTLENLDVSNNKINVVDLTVLKTCKKLNRLDLRLNPIEALEVADLLQLANFKELHVDATTRLTVDGVTLSSQQLHEMIEKGIKDVDQFLAA